MNRKFLVTAMSLLALGASAPALADHNDRRGPQFDYARVISSEPIIRYVTVRTPVRECYDDVEYYSVERRAPGEGAATLFGAVVGGVVGHQFGSGRGNDAATLAGSLIGAAVGNSAARNRHGREVVEYSRPVKRCSTSIHERQEERIDGYRVTYRYKGQKYRTTMPYDPGRELRVRVDVRPVR